MEFSRRYIFDITNRINFLDTITTNYFALASCKTVCDRRMQKYLVLLLHRHGVISIYFSDIRRRWESQEFERKTIQKTMRRYQSPRACGAHLLSPSIWSVGYERAGVIIAHELLPLEETKTLLTGKPSAARARARRRIARDFASVEVYQSVSEGVALIFHRFQFPAAAGISGQQPSWQSRLTFIRLLHAGHLIINAFGERSLSYQQCSLS